MECYRLTELSFDADVNAPEFLEQMQQCTPVLLSENNSGSAAKVRTELRMGYTDQWLYAYFGVEDSEIVSDYCHNNDPLYTQDVVELFLSPTGSLKDYLELEFSPKSFIFDGWVVNENNELKLAMNQNTGSECCSRMVNGGWECRIRVPFTDLKAKPGGSWLFNAYRIDTDTKGAFDLYALNPTLCGSFHKPQFFISLLF